MNWIENIARRPATWAIGLGVVVAGVAVASIVQNAPPSAEPTLITKLGEPRLATSPVNASDALEALRNLDSAYSSLVEYVAPSVVHIRAEGRPVSGPDERVMMQQGGEGSGVIYRSDGWIITNDHVVNGFDEVTVILNDGREFRGKVRRSNDPTLDIAVVKIEATDLKAASFGDSAFVKPGQIAMAVGSPFGLEQTVTVGHISALGRANAIPDPRIGAVRAYSNMIQTDAPINMGNSGGPLMNVDGQVVGINSAIFSGTGGSVGIGFAIPSNQARLVADILIQRGKIERGYLGLAPVNLKPYQLKELGVAEGAIVESVPNDGPAAKAGIKGKDIIVRIGSTKVRDQQDVRNAMLTNGPGSKVEIEVIRDGDRKTYQVEVSEPPAEQRIQAQTQRRRSQEGGGSLPPELEEQMRLFRERMEREIPRGDRAPMESDRPVLGVNVQDISEVDRRQLSIPEDFKGALVVSVMPGSAADRAGIRPGDIIYSFNGKALTGGAELRDSMAGVKKGDTVKLKIRSFGETARTVDLEVKI